MCKSFLCILATIFSLLSSPVFSQNCENVCATSVYFAPEVTYVERLKSGGTKQTGALYGFRLGVDHIKRYKLYWGAEFLWETGTLHGHCGSTHFKSTLTDTNVEGRIGYTFQSKCWPLASITPFFGIGYFWEDNHYKHPSPLTISFNNRFGYVPFGFLSHLYVNKSFSVGFNAKVRWLWDGGEIKVSGDPDYDSSKQKYEEKLQYRLELPITYFYCVRSYSFAFSFEPFYENRCYGGQVNFPFDFIKTTYNFYGVAFKTLYLF